jgi:hypothetical protein
MSDGTITVFRSASLSIIRVRQHCLVRWTPVGVDLKGALVYGRAWEDEFLIPQPYNQAAALNVLQVAAHARLGMLKGIAEDEQ